MESGLLRLGLAQLPDEGLTAGRICSSVTLRERVLFFPQILMIFFGKKGGVNISPASVGA